MVVDMREKEREREFHCERMGDSMTQHTFLKNVDSSCAASERGPVLTALSAIDSRRNFAMFNLVAINWRRFASYDGGHGGETRR